MYLWIVAWSIIDREECNYDLHFNYLIYSLIIIYTIMMNTTRSLNALQYLFIKLCRRRQIQKKKSEKTKRGKKKRA